MGHDTYDEAMSALPVSVRLALWTTAAYTGQLPLEEVVGRAHSRAAVLVTSLAGALLVATINPMAAEADPRVTTTAGAAYTDTTTTTPRETYTTTTPRDTYTTNPRDTKTTTAPASPTKTAPGAPTGVTAIPGDRSAVVSWHAPASDGGSAIEGYLVIASPGDMFAKTRGATSAAVTGLTNGTNYTFTVIALNAAGASVSSAVSAAVTPKVSSITVITPTVARAAAARAAAANAAAANAAAANAAAANPAAANPAAAGSTVIPAGAPSAGAGGASQPSDSPLMGLGALALLLSGAAMVPAIRRHRRA